jgi:hypothetical protein
LQQFHACGGRDLVGACTCRNSAQLGLLCIASDRLTSHVQCTLEHSLATLNTASFPSLHPHLRLTVVLSSATTAVPARGIPCVCKEMLRCLCWMRKARRAPLQVQRMCACMQGERRLGGSALAQAYGQVGSDCPDVDMHAVRAAFETTQKFIKSGQIVSGHDISDGGAAVALLEMAFSGLAGIKVRFSLLLSLLGLIRSRFLTSRAPLICGPRSQDDLRNENTFLRSCVLMRGKHMISGKSCVFLKRHSHQSVLLQHGRDYPHCDVRRSQGEVPSPLAHQRGRHSCTFGAAVNLPQSISEFNLKSPKDATVINHINSA